MLELLLPDIIENLHAAHNAVQALDAQLAHADTEQIHVLARLACRKGLKAAALLTALDVTLDVWLSARGGRPIRSGQRTSQAGHGSKAGPRR